MLRNDITLRPLAMDSLEIQWFCVHGPIHFHERSLGTPEVNVASRQQILQLNLSLFVKEVSRMVMLPTLDNAHPKSILAMIVALTNRRIPNIRHFNHGTCYL